MAIPLNRPGSWILRNKATKEVVCETFNRAAIERLNTAKYEAIPINEYLAEVNRAIKAFASSYDWEIA